MRKNKFLTVIIGVLLLMLSGPQTAIGAGAAGNAGEPRGVAELTLEVPDGCLGSVGELIEVELWMRALPQQVSGFQAFLEYDTVVLEYRGDLSAYTSDPFPLHIQPIGTAEVSPGEINVDGSVGFFEPGTDEEALLVILTFEVLRECVETAVEFRIGPPDSKLSFEGDTVPTLPVDSRDFYLDDTPPMIECPADITVDSLADVPPPDTGSVTASDNCTAVIVTHVGDVNDGGAGCPLEPRIIIRTYRAADECGTGASCTQTITVGDGDLGLEDYVDFAGCWSGPGVPAAPGCECSDFDDDGDVDLEDAQQFQILFSGA